MPTEMRTRSSVTPICLPAVRRHRRVRHRRRMADERLDAAEAFGQRHQPDAVEQRPRVLERAERERRSGRRSPRICLLRQRVLRVRGSPG